MYRALVLCLPHNHANGMTRDELEQKGQQRTNGSKYVDNRLRFRGESVQDCNLT